MENNINPLNDFSNAKVGDLVTSIIYGKGIIVTIHDLKTSIYPICVNFTDKEKSTTYSICGRETEDDNIPTLYKGHIDFKIEPILPIIKEPNYRPYNKPNYGLLGKVVVSSSGSKSLITSVRDYNHYIVGDEPFDALYLCSSFKFEDGTPCGELEE